MTDTSQKRYDISGFKPDHVIPDAILLPQIIQGFALRLWKYDDLPKYIQDDVTAYLKVNATPA